jgi:anti-anti-sigma regulatory factor
VITPLIEEIDERTAVVVVDQTHVWTGEEIDKVFADLKRGGRSRIVVDASNARLLNSKVLAALVRCAADLDPREGAGLALITQHDYVKQIVEITATGGVLFLADSRDDALEALPRPR